MTTTEIGQPGRTSPVPKSAPGRAVPGQSGSGRRRLLVGGAALLALAVIAAVHLSQGAADEVTSAVLWDSRVPRTLAGIIAGVALGVAGSLIQGATRNPLAAPDTLGVNAGAFLGVTLMALVFPGSPIAGTGLAAFLGGLAALGVVWLLIARAPATPGRVLLAGTAVSLAAFAVASMLIIFDEQRGRGIYFWGNGTLLQNNLDKPLTYGIGLLVIVAVAFVLCRPLDTMRLGDDTAEGLGVAVGKIRLVTLVLAVLITACGVTVAGPISFIGLIAPTLVRRFGIRAHAWLLPFAAIMASILVLGADVAARIISPPQAGFAELPVGVIAAMIGGPVFIMLARKVSTGDDDAGAAVAVRNPAGRGAYILTLSVAVALLLAAIVYGLRSGSVPIEFSDLPNWFSDPSVTAVLDGRMARIAVAAAAGAALAAAGATVQSVVRNPLAEPQLLGITGGAAVGAVLVITLAPQLPAEAVPSAAVGGGVLALLLVLWAARSKGQHLDPTRVVLIGIGMAATTMAFVHLLAVRAHMDLTAVLTWLAGSTYQRGWEDFVWLVPALLLAAAMVVMARPLNLLAFGEDLPRSLGMRLGRTRFIVLIIGAGIAALTAGAVGAIGFVGLVAPHLARRIAGANYGRLIPMAALLGAVLVTVADTLGRTLMSPVEIPVGIVTALVGAPYLIWLLRRTA